MSDKIYLSKTKCGENDPYKQKTPYGFMFFTGRYSFVFDHEEEPVSVADELLRVVYERKSTHIMVFIDSQEIPVYGIDLFSNISYANCEKMFANGLIVADIDGAVITPNNIKRYNNCLPPIHKRPEWESFLSYVQ
jgi:hypothetical protein